MIVGISGLPSGGKSYTVVKDLLTWLEGDIVVTNLYLKGKGIDAYFGGWRGWRENLYILDLGSSIVNGQKDMAVASSADWIARYQKDQDLETCKVIVNNTWEWPEGDERTNWQGAKVLIVID